MIIRLVLIALFLAATARFAFQGWRSYKNHRIRRSLFASESITREAQPGVYWAGLMIHTMLATTFFIIAVNLAIGLAQHPH